jgi:hypothetical protein
MNEKHEGKLEMIYIVLTLEGLVGQLTITLKGVAHQLTITLKCCCIDEFTYMSYSECKLWVIKSTLQLTQVAFNVQCI